MQTISQIYDEYLHKRNRTWLIKANIAGTDYGSDVIVDFSVETSVSSGEELELGTANIAKFVLRIKNVVDVPPNARIVPYLALQLPDSLNGADVAWQDADIAWEDSDFPWQGAVTEWLPLGEFFVDTRAVIQGNVLELTCADRLRFADVAYVSGLSYPASMQAVWDEICGLIGFSYGDTVQINPSYRIEAGPAGYSARQVLGYIAGLHGACVVVDRWGLIQWRQFSAAHEPVAVFTKADYVKVTQTNPEKTYTRLMVVYNSDDGLAYERGSGDDNHTLTVDNPFATPAMVDDLFARLNGFSYVPVQMDVRGYPQFDAGDRIRYGTPSSQADITWDAADIAWQDADITWDGYDGSRPGGSTLLLHLTYTFKGGLKMSFEATSKSEQQSEYRVQGSLSAALDRLRATAVREGKSYFGLTITREDGLTIEREDHLSKLILNSDVMDWQVNGESALYLDAQEAKLKFNGTLEAVDGTFSGELQAATGTFAGALQAATGTFAGSLQAATGTFTGDLIAAGGTFSGNLSAAGGTFTGTLQGVDGTFSGTLQAANGSFTGTLQGANGSFSGTISASTINGGTITGALIRTAASGTRIELSSAANLLTAYYNDNYYISINPLFGGGPAIRFYNGGSNVGNIMMGTNSLFLDAPIGIVLNTPTVIVQGSWNQLQIPGQTMQQALDSKANTTSVSAKADTAYVNANFFANAAYDPTTKNLKFFSANGVQIASVNISGS